MKIGIGLPNTVVGATGRQIKDWARRADQLGFSTLGTIGRVAYPNYESLTALAAAAAVTERIGLMTDILLGPTYEPVQLAKMAAGLDQLSEGRFVMGAAVGGREDDFSLVGYPFGDRGKRWDAALDLMHRAWKGEILTGTTKVTTVTPVNGGSVPMMFGGNSEKTIQRVVRWGVGWTAGGGGPQPAAEMAAKVRAAWQDAGREGSPRITALGYYGVGPHATENIEGYLGAYYDYLPQYLPMMIAGTPRDAESIKGLVGAFEAAGVDELILFPTAATLDQVDDLAEAVL